MPKSDLEEYTQTYWNISSSMNGRYTPITTELAFKQINEVRDNLGPKRRLIFHVGALCDAVIAGPKRRKKSKISAIILQHTGAARVQA